ncbi:MAG TPA: hypothetical protein VMW81_01345 [Nitrospinota bacterium]|nr:hypothetical protein [Nitrospinota bacterium]
MDDNLLRTEGMDKGERTEFAILLDNGEILYIFINRRIKRWDAV